MRWASSLALGALAILGGATVARAENMLYSQALETCMDKSQFTADKFTFTLSPKNKTVVVSFAGITTIEGFVDVEISLLAYGFKAYTQKLDPCKEKWTQLCPMRAGKMPPIDMRLELDDKTLAMIPGMNISLLFATAH